jgi:hypothetical protein
MTSYYVNKQAQTSGDHEVHTGNCSRLPNQANQKYLGQFSNCRDAVREARKHFRQVNGCYYCCKPCHTS